MNLREKRELRCTIKLMREIKMEKKERQQERAIKCKKYYNIKIKRAKGSKLFKNGAKDISKL